MLKSDSVTFYSVIPDYMEHPATTAFCCGRRHVLEAVKGFLEPDQPCGIALTPTAVVSRLGASLADSKTSTTTF